ncbi:MAG: hypothetical protein RsTaC01_0598 [Candidatus Paraimprobicoccus trichonymphae]|uniref:Uncharacterized protein n=1 Tax=Candidatus Paraimprobicoccus trichonymphae TaxID=3033793 RepID=A0AA48IHE9_9FIRM|nr:MAG: hypothetical protein RsTaC01_0598 [Candidatus Paraimprobicoccus trichonymphae]
MKKFLRLKSVLASVVLISSSIFSLSADIEKINRRSIVSAGNALGVTTGVVALGAAITIKMVYDYYYGFSFFDVCSTNTDNFSFGVMFGNIILPSLSVLTGVGIIAYNIVDMASKCKTAKK